MNRAPVHQKWHARRQRAERRFRLYGQMALAFAVLMLVILLGSIFTQGASGFIRTEIKLSVTFDPALMDIGQDSDLKTVSGTAFTQLVQHAVREQFPAVTDRTQRRKLYDIVSDSAGLALKRILQKNPHLMSTTQEVWVPASNPTDFYVKGKIPVNTPESERKVSNAQIGWIKHLQQQGRVQTAFNAAFFTGGDSRAPEQAGFLGAMIGSALTLIICLLVVFPIGVMTAIYLEEFARPGKLVDVIEVNINNLAAVPSIVFGLLGLAVYINVMGLPRSATLVGGLTLALMVLPVIIIATRAALQAVPGSIRDAARALGASPLQVVWHHTLPLSMPGIMTGTILGMARAIGETAPLLMIGMVAFVVDLPDGFTAPSTVMPVQVYLWASSPEAGFAEKTAAGILVLLMLLLGMNALAIYLRKKFEIRW